jgi:hypothetical protein
MALHPGYQKKLLQVGIPPQMPPVAQRMIERAYEIG